MESFNPHEYVPRRLDAAAQFLRPSGPTADSSKSVIPDTDFITSTGSFLLEPLSALRHRAAAFLSDNRI